MRKFAFITRHTPTQAQYALAAIAGIEIVPVGDHDAFRVLREDFDPDCNKFEGAIVVHPAAMGQLLALDFYVGVFENGTRAEEGKPVVHTAKSLHLYLSRPYNSKTNLVCSIVFPE